MNGLPWVRLDTTFPESPKVLELTSRRGGHAAGFVYLCGLAYAGRHGTDGFIPAAALPRLHGKRADAALLVDLGLWRVVDTGGWMVHDWAEYQQTAETTQIIRDQQKSGGAKGNCVRWHGEQCGCWRNKTNLRAIR